MIFVKKELDSEFHGAFVKISQFLRRWKIFFRHFLVTLSVYSINAMNCLAYCREQFKEIFHYTPSSVDQIIML